MSSPEIDPAALARWSAELEGLPPGEILAAVAARFPGRVGFATGFGPEGCVLLDAAARRGVALDLFTLDTGVLFPETYALWRRLEARYGFTIRRVASPVAAPAPASGPAPWDADPDACCNARKVAPLAAELGNLDAWITAIRRDQTPERAGAAVVERDARFGLVKVNPLAAWTSREVWDYLRAHDVPVSPLHERGYTSIGCAPCTSPVTLGDADPRAGRWRGRQKTECGIHWRMPATAQGGRP